MEQTLQFLVNHGLPLVFAAVFLDQMGLPLPAIPWLLAAGALSAAGKLNLFSGLAVTVIACLVADAIWFYLGRFRGAQVLGLLCRISLEPDSCVRRTQNLFTRYGARGLVVAKFLPGMSTLAPPLAGMSGLSAARFFFFDGLGSVLYGSGFILFGFFFSAQIERIASALAGIGGGALGLLVGALALYLGYKYWQRQRLLRELRMARITADELRGKVEAGENPFILDLRSNAEFELDSSIILGAIHLGLDEIEKRQHEFPRDRDIILYCSCPNEVTSARVARLLQRRGFTRVRPLLGGIDAWRKLNYPMTARAAVVTTAVTIIETSPAAGPGPLPGETPARSESHEKLGEAQNRMNAGTVTGLLVAAVMSLCLAGCKSKSNAGPSAPLVEITTVRQADVPIYHEWLGVLDGLVNAEIRAQVVGYLQKQDYQEGDPIKKGDVLFEIDPRPFQAVLDQAKGLLAQAQARYGKTELDVKRYAPLVKDRAISQEEYDDAVQADLEAKAAVVSAQAAVEQAQLNLGFTRITSPIDGIASIAKAQIGDLVGPATGDLTTVSTIDPIKAYYNVTEQAYINFTRLFTTESNRYERLRQFDTELILTDGKAYPFKGANFAVDREIGPTTGALRVEARFPNPENALRPGEFARIRLKFETKHGALLVPQRAVSELQGSYQVDVVDAENKVHIQPVQVGERTGTDWIIEDGLHRGDCVVVEGIQKVREGTFVIQTNFMAASIAQSMVAPPRK